MNKRRFHFAFTLIELLVVISIIALLAGIAGPVYSGVILTGKMTAAMNRAKQIGYGLLLYANDHESFPTEKNAYGEAINTSNDAFRSLIPTYMESESVFPVPGSKAGATADNRIDSPANILARGENHWAYVAGLSNTSNSAYPLIVDHTDGSGYYTDRENTVGGTWKGKKAVVIRTDLSGHIVPLVGASTKRYLPRHDEQSRNALQTDYMGDDVKLLEPSL